MKKAGWMKQVCCLILIGVMACGETIPVQVTAQAGKGKKEAQQRLDEANKAVKAVEANKAATQNQVDQLSVEPTALPPDIHILKTGTANKGLEIAQVEQDYVAAVKQESEQYNAMKKQIQHTYEQGDTEYLDVLLQVEGMADLSNKTEYMSDTYAYDRRQLETYREAKQEVEDIKTRLLDEKAETEVMGLEYKEQQGQLESIISRKRQKVSDFDAQYTKAERDAVVYTRMVEQKSAQIKKAQEEAARKAVEEAAKKKAVEGAAKRRAAPTSSSSSTPSKESTGFTGTSSSSGSKTTTKSSGGTAEGRVIVNHGLTFVGNPYIYGGTSLINGTDCSGFTQEIYVHSGYSTPRNSAAQRSAGREVTYEDVEPGGLICCVGHAVTCIGNGQIVHVSTPATEIKVSPTAYRTTLSVRRIIS